MNRQNIDLREIRKSVIQTYYQEVISPNLRSVINDSNLVKANRIYMCGGAMYYEELIDCFKEEFGKFTEITVLDNPETLASRGYAINSLRVGHGKFKSSVGIDIGNATTVVANFSGE